MLKPVKLSEADWGHLPADLDVEKFDVLNIAYTMSKLACELKLWEIADQNTEVDFTADKYMMGE